MKKSRILKVIGVATIASLQGTSSYASLRESETRASQEMCAEQIADRVLSIATRYESILVKPRIVPGEGAIPTNPFRFAQFDNFLDGGSDPFNDWNDAEPFGDYWEDSFG